MLKRATLHLQVFSLCTLQWFQWDGFRRCYWACHWLHSVWYTLYLKRDVTMSGTHIPSTYIFLKLSDQQSLLFHIFPKDCPNSIDTGQHSWKCFIYSTSIRLFVCMCVCVSLTGRVDSRLRSKPRVFISTFVSGSDNRRNNCSVPKHRTISPFTFWSAWNAMFLTHTNTHVLYWHNLAVWVTVSKCQMDQRICYIIL